MVRRTFADFVPVTLTADEAEACEATGGQLPDAVRDRFLEQMAEIRSSGRLERMVHDRDFARESMQ